MEGRDFLVDLVEGIHVHLLIVFLHLVAVLVVLGEFAENGAELDPIIAVPYVFQQHMSHVLLEDVESKHKDEEVRDLLLENHPELMLVA